MANVSERVIDYMTATRSKQPTRRVDTSTNAQAENAQLYDTLYSSLRYPRTHAFIWQGISLLPAQKTKFFSCSIATGYKTEKQAAL